MGYLRVVPERKPEPSLERDTLISSFRAAVIDLERLASDAAIAAARARERLVLVEMAVEDERLDSSEPG